MNSCTCVNNILTSDNQKYYQDILSTYLNNDVIDTIFQYLFWDIKIGDIIDIGDVNRNWYLGIIMDISIINQNTNLYIHYIGWINKWIEWVCFCSCRVRPREVSNHKFEAHGYCRYDCIHEHDDQKKIKYQGWNIFIQMNDHNIIKGEIIDITFIENTQPIIKYMVDQTIFKISTYQYCSSVKYNADGYLFIAPNKSSH